MLFKHLEWDSSFFEKKIGRIDFSPKDSESDIIKEIQTKTDYQLIYIFSDSLLNLPIIDPRCKLVDQKVTYLSILTQDILMISENKNVTISEFSGKATPIEIELLAYQSGEYSRFKTDKGFDPKDYYRLYKKWIDNSIKKEIADAVYTAYVDDKLAGFVSAKFDKRFAKIGLIAVDQNSRGNKIGSSLISHLKKISFEKGIENLFVDTQHNNIDACRFYEKNGFSQNKLVNIYHFWI